MFKSDEKLKEALWQGAEQYLKMRNNQEKVNSGFFHGKKGMTKANNLSRIAKSLENKPLRIFALSYALFYSSAKGLPMCVAEIAIKGTWNDSYVFHGEYCKYDELESDVFDMALVRKAAMDDENQNDTGSSEYSTSHEFNKRKGMKSILKNKIKTLSQSDKEKVNGYVETYKKALRSENKKELEMKTITTEKTNAPKK